MLTLADTGVTADWFSLNWFALFRGEKKPTLPQRELVKLPHDVQRAYLAVTSDLYDSEHGRWWHENYWKWKLFKRL